MIELDLLSKSAQGLALFFDGVVRAQAVSKHIGYD